MMTVTNKPWKVLDSRGATVASQAIAKQRKMLSAYKGAVASRTTADWSATQRSADSTLLPERWSLIYRIRERLRNDPVLRGAFKKMVDSVIGPKGFTTQAQLDYERIGISEQQAQDIEANIDSLWEDWQRHADYSGNPARRFTFLDIVAAQFSNEIATGENFTIPRYLRRPWCKWSFCVQPVSTDRIMSPGGYGQYARGVRTTTEKDIRDGIEIGRNGEMVGAYVTNRHPYEYFAKPTDYSLQFIPAWNRRTKKANIWHNYQLYRPEATRGEPAFAACLLGFKSLGDYISDEIVRAHMATMFGLTIHREEAFDPDIEGVSDSDRLGDGDEDDWEQVQLYSGMINYLKPGEKADVVNPNVPGPQFESFTDKIATWAGSPLGLSREQMLNSYNGMSFSSAKASRDEVQRGFKKLQDDVVVSYIEPPRERVIEEAWMRGYIDLPGFENPEIRELYFAHQTYASPWPYLEPVKEEKGVELRMKNGTSTLAIECAAKGQNFRKLTLQRAAEKKFIESTGLPLPDCYKDEPEPEEMEPQAPQNNSENEETNE